MNYPPHLNLTRPDAADKWERESPQRWMKQEQEGRSSLVSSNTATRPLSPRTTRQGEIKIEAKQQIRKRPQGVPGTNVHSAYAGISVHNALLNLGPPPPNAKVGSKHLPWLRLTDWEMMNLRQRMKKNAKWRPSDEMIKKELSELGRGPRGYAKAKEEATIRGVEFLDEDSVENQGLHRKTLLSDKPFLGPNRGMILNQAKKRRREAQVLPPEVTTLEGSVQAHAAKQQRLRASDAATNGRKTMGGPKPDRAYDRIYRVSAGKANNEGVESKQKPTMVTHDLPSIEAIQPLMGHEEERKRMGLKSDDFKRVVRSGYGADLFKAGRATNSGSNVPQPVPAELGPNNSDPLMKPPLAGKPRPALTAHANTVVPIDLTDMSFTDSDASSATSSEGYEMSAPPTSLDESPSSESSAESSLGDVSLQPPKTHSSDKPPIFYDLSLDLCSEMGTGADTGVFPGGDQSLAASPAISTDNVLPGKLGSIGTSSARKRDKDHAYGLAPKDDTRAILVEPAITNTVTHGPMSSRTPLDRQAREIVFAAVTRAIELGGPSMREQSDEKSLPNPTSAVVPPTTQLGNACGSIVTRAAIPRLHHPSEDEALSNLTPAGNENVYATTSTIIKPEATTVGSSTKPETNTYQVSEPVVSTPTLLRGPSSACTYERYERLKLKQAVDTAVARSEELGEPSFGHSLGDLYEQSLRDPTIADLLVAVLLRKPLLAQAAEFSNRIAATNRNLVSQVHQNASVSSVLSSPSISTAAPVLPVRTTSVLSNNRSPSIAESANPRTRMKPPTASLTTSSRGVAGSTIAAGPECPPVTSRNSNILSTSTATSIPPSTTSSNPSDGQSSVPNKLTNPPTPVMPPPPFQPRVSIGVPGGSGVMVWNRARRRARIAARESGSVVATQQDDCAGKNSVINSNERHQRLRDFVVNGKIT